MSSKPTSEEQFLPATLLTGNVIVRISIFQNGVWVNYHTNLDALLQWLSVVANPPVAVTSVTGVDSISATPNPITAAGVLRLVNDSAAPGNLKYYGTDSGGAKGFFDIPQAVITDIDVSANPDYPAATKGDMYRAINGTGKIGGGSGIQADTGDIALCLVTNAGGDQATVGSSWALISGFDPIAKGYGESALQQTILTGTANQAMSPRSGAYGEGSKAVNNNAVAMGSGSVAAGKNSHAKGLNVHAGGNYSTAEGEGTRTGAPPKTFTRSGNTVTIVGDVTADYDQTAEIALYDLTGGVLNEVFIINGLQISTAPVFGGVNTTFNVNFLAANMGDRTGGTIAPVGIRGVGAHAEGKNTVAFDRQSHAEGLDTIARGFASHAEGSGSRTGNNALGGHAEGSNTQANGVGSHSEGINSIASGFATHAGGNNSQAALSSQYARASTQFAESGDAQTSYLYPTAITTSNQTKELFIDSVAGLGGIVPIEPNGVTQLWNFELFVQGQQIGGTAGNIGDSYAIQISGAIKKVGGVLSVVGIQAAPTLEVADAGVGFAFDKATLAATGVFQVVGEVDKNVRWSGWVKIGEIAAAMV